MAMRTVPFKDGMKPGLGFNRLTGDILPSPAVHGKTSSLQGAGGQQVTIDCSVIQDVKTLHKALGINVDAGGAYMGFSGSSKTDYANSFDFSSFSTYVVVKASVQNAVETFDDPAFSEEANQLLINNNPDRFRQRFGDSFITGIKKGGEYFAIFQVTGSNESEKETVSEAVQLAFGNPLAGASLNTTIKTEMARSSSHLAINLHVFRQGTIATADLNLEDIMKTARQFPLDVAGDMSFAYVALVQDYAVLKNPNDKFNYIDIQNRQDVLEDLGKRRFEFLALRDDIRYILKHLEDFQNADGTPLDRAKLGQELDEIVNAINSMEKEAKNCSQDATQCKFTLFDAGKFAIPVLAKKTEDVLLTKGAFIVSQDPLAVMLRDSLPDDGSKRGFNVAFGVDGAAGTAPGPGKDKLRDALPSDEREGFNIAVSYFTVRNKNQQFINTGIKIAAATPVLSAARTSENNAFFILGFDIATGLFGDPALGGQGDILMGPGKQAVLDSMNAVGKRGFNASMKIHLGPPALPRQNKK